MLPDLAVSVLASSLPPSGLAAALLRPTERREAERVWRLRYRSGEDE